MFRPLLAAFLLTPAAAHAAPRPTVLELFTSESCSSCPPADNLLAELARTRPDLLPLAFHVDYWNALSWKDHFSSPAATARQRRYAAAIGSEVYTPQLVVNGRWQAVGSDRAAVTAAITEAQANQPAGPDVSVTGDSGNVTVIVGGGQGSGEVLLVGFDNLHSTNVELGENAGTALNEANVVRSLAHLGVWSGTEMHMNVPHPAGERLAVLIQASDGSIIGLGTN